MSNISVRKLATGSTTVGGLVKIRPERIDTAVVKLTAVSAGDVYVFDDLPAEKLLWARIVATDNSTGAEFVAGLSPEITVANADGKNLVVVVHYARGTGDVADAQGKTLKLTIGATVQG